MKKNTFIILAVILIIFAGAAALVLYTDKPRQAELPMGSLLFTGLDVNEAALIELSGPDGEFSVIKEKDGWMVDHGFLYPAEFPKISRFLNGIMDLKVGRSFPATKERMARLSLLPLENGIPKKDMGADFTMKDKDGKVMARLITGAERPSKGQQQQQIPNGQYVMKNKEDVIYLIDRYFQAPQQSAT